MAATSTVELVIEARNNTGSALQRLAGAVRTITQETNKQQKSTRELIATEARRAAQSRLQFATEEKQRKAQIAFQKGTSRAILEAQKASERYQQAQARVAILSQQGAEATEKTGALAKAGFGDALKAAGAFNLALQAINFTVGLLTTGFNKLNNSIQDAINREVEVLGQQQTIVKVLGLSRQEAALYVENFNKRVAELGRDLPTSSEKIQIFARTIQDDYAKALKEAGASTKLITNAVLASSARIALASEAANVDVGTANAAIQSFLAGGIASKAGLNQLEFFARNTQLRESLVTQLEGTGRTGFNQLTALQRVSLLNKALEQAYTKEDIAELQGTVKSQFAALGDTLTDPEVGLFSVVRDLEKDVEGRQSVFTSFKRTVDLVIGEEGIFYTLGNFFNTDPMIAVRDYLDRFNTFLQDVQESVTGLENFDAAAIGAIAGTFLADITSQALIGIFQLVTSIDYGALAIGLTTGIVSFFANLDWRVYLGAAVAVFVAPIISGLVAGVGFLAAGFVTTLIAATAGLPVTLIVAIGLGIAALVAATVQNFDAIKKGVGGFFSGIGNAIGGIISFIGDGVVKFFGGIPQLLATALFAPFGVGVTVVGAAILNNWGGITSTVANLGSSLTIGIINFFKKGYQSVIKILDSAISSVKDFLFNILEYFADRLGEIVEFFGVQLPQTPTPALTTATSPVAAVTENASTAITPAPNQSAFVAGSFNTAASSPTVGLLQRATGLIFGARHEGQIPNRAISAVGGLIDAIRTESQFKPFDSDLVIANTSEAILTPSMLQNLVNNSISYGATNTESKTINIEPGAFQINLPAGTPQEIAIAALEFLEEKLKFEMETRLT